MYTKQNIFVINGRFLFINLLSGIRNSLIPNINCSHYFDFFCKNITFLIETKDNKNINNLLNIIVTQTQYTHIIKKKINTRGK